MADASSRETSVKHCVHTEGFQTRPLSADDDTATRNLLSGLLKAEGYRVFGAQDGQEALDFLITGDPTVALLDVMMPKLTGFEVCVAAKANSETRLIPIVLLTGLSSTDDRIRGNHLWCG